MLGEAGAGLWSRTVAYGSRWIASSDYDLLLAACMLCDELAVLRGEVARVEAADQKYYFTDSGRMYAHPAVEAFDRKLGQFVKMLERLGLTPVDRARLGVAEVKARSALEKMMERRGGR